MTGFLHEKQFSRKTFVKGAVAEAPSGDTSLNVDQSGAVYQSNLVNDLSNPNMQVATILVGPSVRQGYQSTTKYQHQSTLKLTMQLIGVNDYPGLAAGATDMSEFF